MTELLFYRSKAYSVNYSSDDEVRRLKGITKSIIKHNIIFQNFKDAVTELYEKVFYRKIYVFNSNKHEMYDKKINKKAVSPYDDKRWLSDDGIVTFPHSYNELLFT